MRNSSRRIFIGDVHGHYDGLMRLLEAIALEETDRLYFVGDLIDRGPKSAQVVKFVRAHADGCVLGNHEQLLLEAFPKGKTHVPALQGWLYSGGQSTLSSYGASIDQLLEDVQWIRSLPLFIDLNNLWLVHAGVNPKLSLSEQTHHDLCWIRDPFHTSANPYFADKLIITGHTITFTLPQVEPGQLAHGQGWIDIDTGAYHPKSGWLTGVDFDNEQVYQINVFDHVLRKRSLADATTPIQPNKVKLRSRSATR
ncbi:MAG: serine/threonine protein phosphatase [Leptolyngbyaceae cyanobacterium SM1_1_3]|nr:serine/threonine protein phosphatase [Leptolyngbyaceae cyanobacterium SM1_1_3]NJN02840.1 serine/threonine protein phosphatase [Leptolyngbyaceae cyanobacterium RM1_1_2]NJO09084.1 serine/threonine protein phosphatase [Leptolyngbyaceae cyanobacterium SL_1_1]